MAKSRGLFCPSFKWFELVYSFENQDFKRIVEETSDEDDIIDDDIIVASFESKSKPSQDDIEKMD